MLKVKTLPLFACSKLLKLKLRRKLQSQDHSLLFWFLLFPNPATKNLLHLLRLLSIALTQKLQE